MLTVTVKDSRAYISGEIVVAGSVNYPKLKFVLPDDWGGCSVEAHFEGSGRHITLKDIAEQNIYKVPWECITCSGELFITLKALTADECRTVVRAATRIHESECCQQCEGRMQSVADFYDRIMAELDYIAMMTGIELFQEECNGQIQQSQ